jgi:hypothetical protein
MAKPKGWNGTSNWISISPPQTRKYVTVPSSTSLATGLSLTLDRYQNPRQRPQSRVGSPFAPTQPESQPVFQITLMASGRVAVFQFRSLIMLLTRVSAINNNGHAIVKYDVDETYPLLELTQGGQCWARNFCCDFCAGQ